MRFLSKLDEYYKLLKEEPVTQDAAAPDPNAAPGPETQPEASKQVAIAPEGYVNIVRMLAKALVMNIPTSEIDTIFTTQEINKENALEMQKGIEAVMRDNEVKEDNFERIRNPNYNKFVDAINEKNFMQKYEYLLGIMKKQSPYIK
jgi:hypothetical protein